MLRFADPGAIFAGGAGTARAGAAAGLPALDDVRATTFAAGLRAAGFALFALRALGREPFFRAGAGFFFFRAAVGIRLLSLLDYSGAPVPAGCD
jgi:hypothetical protein